jgi:hypothetical protein
MFVFVILLRLIEKLPITLSIVLDKYRIIMNTNISLTEINTPNGAYQTEITVSNDETNNVSCFNRATKKIKDSRATIFTTLACASFSGIIGMVSHLVAQTQTLTCDYIIDPSNHTEIESQIQRRSIALLEHNDNAFFYTSIASHALLGGSLYLLLKYLKK